MRFELWPAEKRIIHVVAANLKKRLDENDPCELVGIRSFEDQGMMFLCRKVDILGPCAVAEIETPIPGTNGRGICPLITEAPLKVYFDE